MCLLSEYISRFLVWSLSHYFITVVLFSSLNLVKYQIFIAVNQEPNQGLRGTFLGEREDDFFKPTIRSLRKRVQDHTGSRKEFLSSGHLGLRQRRGFK